MASKDRGLGVRLRCALRTLYRIGYYLIGCLSVIDRIIGITPSAEYAEFLETIEGVRVSLLSVSGDSGG